MAWIAKNDFLGIDDMTNNATEAYYALSKLGWSLNAISAICGNMQSESTINPGIWENLSPFDPEYGGYGLVQWTPWTKYSEWAGTGWENNGQKEIERIEYEAENGLQWFYNPEAPEGFREPVISFAEFKISKLEPETLANYFLWWYEHPANPNQPGRGTQARYWYNLFSQISPPVADATNFNIIYNVFNPKRRFLL